MTAVVKLADHPAHNSPDPIDVHVGLRMRLRRTLLGVTQEQMAKALGLTCQQIQKYEHGINRMGSSRLFQVSKVLSVPVCYFFERLPAQGAQPSPDKQEDCGSPSPIEELNDPVLNNKETLALVKAYYRIRDEDKRRNLLELIQSLSR